MTAILFTLLVAASGAVAAASPAIERANGEWLPALKAGDADTLAAPYAPNAVFLLPDGAAVIGRDAIRRLYAGGGKGTDVLDGAIESRGRTALSEDLVLEWGDGAVTRRDSSGAAKTARSHYVTTWARQLDGQWKIVRNLVFPD